MPHRKLPPPSVISSLGELEALARDLAGRKRLAVDMESDGFFAYHEKICLLQLSTESEDFVIDPLPVKDLSPLGALFRDPSVEKVFHACEYDIVCLKRDFGFAIHGVFDTMVASRALGAQKLGLAAAIEKHFGVRLSKKLQRANWGKRPLSPEQIQYARLDTHYLLRLRDILDGELRERRLWEDAQDQFRRLERIEPPERVFDPDDFWRLPGAKELPPQKRAVLRRLYLFRERTAAELDRAPFRVMPEHILIRVAESCPRGLDAVREVRGMTPYLFSHYGRALHEEVLAGLEEPPIEQPPERARPRWENETMRRYEALREWRKTAAEQRGVNPVVILATEELKALAEATKNPDPEAWLAALSEHKRRTYGAALLEILQRPVPAKAKRRRRRRRRSEAGAEHAPQMANE